MLEPAEVLGHIRVVLGRAYSKLKDKKIVVTAGGTQEAIDPVRYITNRSSGKQGYAVAQAALDAGADVTLIATPTALTAPVGAKLVSVRSAQEMLEAVLAESAGTDALIMAAAVADFRLAEVAANKRKNRDGIPQIQLEAAPDILGTVASLNPGANRPQVVVGFAAESRDLIANSSEKMKSKKMDMIVANDISATDAGFDVEENRVTILLPDGQNEKLSLRSKFSVAETIIGKLTILLEK